MGQITQKIRPASGFSHFLHLGLIALLPALIFVLVRIRFAQLALLLILLSKWRMFAVRPRYWFANILQNAVDIMVGVSVLVFMVNSSTMAWQLTWAVLYGVWLMFIKPGSSIFKISIQALIAQFAALVALFLAWVGAPVAGLVIGAWAICYLSARHFFSGFDETHNSLYSHTWGYFGGALAWVFSHWLYFFYGIFARPALLLVALGVGMASLYYLDETDRLSSLWRNQFIFIMIAVAVLLLLLPVSSWGDNVIR